MNNMKNNKKLHDTTFLFVYIVRVIICLLKNCSTLKNDYF